ncbi:MFS general substrate transporter [Cylindrobasidium torrendii FP15055 ss-10]|uniref:MFS general substrate transporter n=1 Tax=Cylindrobasidium torrendii FP15055 ss-10 TaxID=1314674 RepID=A0A0D7B898_9AGAR|nr:MFS general substrate transporter [Cylindrobasidium torrendii FP15055 ss-10]
MSSSPSGKVEQIELATRIPLPMSQRTLTLAPEIVNPDLSSSTIHESSLAPVDRGVGAVSFLFAAFFVEGIIWGFPSAYGVFLDYYLNDPRYATQSGASTLLPIIGPISSGIIYCSGVCINPFMSRYPYHRRTSMWLGVICCFASLFGASYATRIEALVVLQGVLYAVGGSLLYIPCISYLSEWFVERRGFAQGVLFAGTSVGGLLLPLTLPHLIDKLGITVTLRALAVAILIILIVLVPFVRPRIPDSRTQTRAPAPVSNEWMTHTSLWVALASNTMQGFGYFVPIVWLPTFAREVHTDSGKRALTVALLNGAAVVGRVSVGYLSDIFEPWTIAVGTLLSTSVATFILWGLLSKTFAGVIAYGIVYGVLASGWTSLWAGFVRPVAKHNPRLVTALYSYFLFSRGLGNILSTPISAALIKQTTTTMAHFPMTGRYENMIIYVGTCFAGAAGLCLGGWAISLRTGHNAAGAD